MLGPGNRALDVPDRKKVLRTISRRLREYPDNFHLGLLDRTEEAVVQGVYWVVKDNHVLLEVYRRGRHHTYDQCNLCALSEPIAQAFRSYFHEALWRRIPARNRHNERVARWLDELCEGIE
jgi:hypothetical protein